MCNVIANFEHNRRCLAHCPERNIMIGVDDNFLERVALRLLMLNLKLFHQHKRRSALRNNQTTPSIIFSKIRIFIFQENIELIPLRPLRLSKRNSPRKLSLSPLPLESVLTLSVCFVPRTRHRPFTFAVPTLRNRIELAFLCPLCNSTSFITFSRRRTRTLHADGR